MQGDVRYVITSFTSLVVALAIIFALVTVASAETNTGIIYIYSADTTNAKSYVSLLEDNGYRVNMIPVSKVEDTDLSQYNVIITGTDTEWIDIDTVTAIRKSGRPVIGIGEGGYSLFGQIGLVCGHPNGWHGSVNSIYVVDASNTVFQEPNVIKISRDGILQLYSSTNHIGIYIPSMTEEILMLGREPENKEHYPLLFEENRYFLWGFTASPESMTDNGKALFINTVAYMSGLETQPEKISGVETPAFTDIPLMTPELNRIQVIEKPLRVATPVKTMEKKTGDTFDLGDGYVMLISEVSGAGEVQVLVEQDGKVIEEKILLKGEDYLLPKFTGENIHIVVEDINMGAMPTDTHVIMLVVPYLLLTVVSQPSGAEIFIDGNMVDSSPSQDIVLTDFDEHEIQLKLEGYRVHEETIRFTPGEEAQINKEIQLISSEMEVNELMKSEEEENEQLTDNSERKKTMPSTDIETSDVASDTEPEVVPGFLATIAAVAVICGYGLIRKKKRQL
ncbi:PEGA domain-containing protein [Methanolobus sp. ZRKC5]|uniref:PEGA domain-containing protein n=1 Tax=unclassified Methanolobus TaxID=2629569 RepID=UPI00313DBAC2